MAFDESAASLARDDAGPIPTSLRSVIVISRHDEAGLPAGCRAIRLLLATEFVVNSAHLCWDKKYHRLPSIPVMDLHACRDWLQNAARSRPAAKTAKKSYRADSHPLVSNASDCRTAVSAHSRKTISASCYALHFPGRHAGGLSAPASSPHFHPAALRWRREPRRTQRSSRR